MKKSILRFFTIIILSLTLNNSYSQEFVNESHAKDIATNFFRNVSNRNNVELSLFHTEKGLNDIANLYIFNVKDGGFVIVSASKYIKPVLAYSYKNNFENEIPETVRYFIDNYRNSIDYQREIGTYSEESVLESWSELEENKMRNKNISVVDPLIETMWNQDCYYNEYAPYDNYGPCNRAYAGCVACAMSQVMKYWNYPEHGKGSHTYNHNDYGNLSANFSETEYKWDEMPNEIWSHNDAIATLMYQCGVSVDMDYGPDGSGAQSIVVENAMRMYFGYSAAKYKERKNYSDTEWIDMLKEELDIERPMYFSGSSETSGHAIVCDGYDNQDYFHFNMGWSGYGNGFYSIDDVGGYNQNQAVVMEIEPLPINADENGIIYVTPDGTGDGSSWENATSLLQYASSVATDGKTSIWVKAGTYYGDTLSENGAFYMYKSNRVYGGFAGNESPDFNLDDRDLEANQTILDGQNARRVLYQNDHFINAFYAVWDGFTIQNGNAGAGGGAYLCSNSRLYDCKFLNNSANGFGGAIRILSAKYSNAISKIENCHFENNIGSLGGAIFDMTGALMINNTFINNTATTKGGALYVYANKEPEIVNCIFADNNASEGGAIFNRGKISMVNCNIINNIALENAGGILNEGRYNNIYNSVIWNNYAADEKNQIMGSSNFVNCAIEGGFEGTNIINLSPLNVNYDDETCPMFMDPENHNYMLMEGSPLINAGDKNLDNVSAKDIIYNNRVVGGQVDIGAYEFQGNESINHNDAIKQCLVFPNPVNNTLFIKGSGVLNIIVYNHLGQKIFSDKITDNTNINTNNWKPGLYIININGSNYKIVK